MTRDEAYKILKTLITNENLIKHHLACEVAMKALYKKLNKEQNPKDEEKWGIVGLLHDADYELTKDTPEKHTLVLEEKIGNLLEADVLHAIKSHNHKYSKVEPTTPMDFSIVCADELTGLIIAAALISPEKKLASIDENFVLNRFNEKSFAKGASRDQIKQCKEKLGIPLNEFIKIVLTSMQGISSELGL